MRNTYLLVTLLQSLGFIVNFKKSSLIPSQVITFLGFKIDSTSMMLSLPGEKVNKILDCCHCLLAPQKITLRNLASLIGLLESSRPAIWRAPLHFRHLQCNLIWGLQMNRRPNCSVNECQRRTDLVVEKHLQYKRQPCTPPSSRYANHDRLLHERLGCSASVPRDQWQMVKTGVPPTHQLPGAESSLLGFKNLSQRQVPCNCISTNREHDHHRLHQQQRGYTFPPTPISSPGTVGLVPGKRHLCDSFSHPRKRQRLCRQGVERIQGHERVEVRPNHHPSLPVSLSDRLVRESPYKPTEGLHQLETRSRGHPHRHLHDNLGSSARLCLPPIQLDIQDSGESNDRPNRDDSSSSNLASPASVAGPVEASNISASVTA